jgi:hypothetical protein
MIAIVVATFFVDRAIACFIAWRKIGVKLTDIYMLKDVGKTAFASIIAGAVTFSFDWFFDKKIIEFSANLTNSVFPNANENMIDFVSGSMILGISALIFAPIYLFLMNRFGLLEDGEKRIFKQIFQKLGFTRNPV